MVAYQVLVGKKKKAIYKNDEDSNKGAVLMTLISDMEGILSMLNFFLGCLIGWLTNHWYSVNLKQPLLKQSGGGGGSNIFGVNLHYSCVNIQNELRQLSISFPETILLGKRLKTSFGNQIIERDNASECRAQLLDEFGKHICHLFWLDNNKVLETVDIKSGKTAKLILFIRKENEEKFYVYEPTSPSDLTPKVTKVPNFNKSTNFLVRISYSHNKALSFPVGVEIDFAGNFYTITKNSSGLF